MTRKEIWKRKPKKGRYAIIERMEKTTFRSLFNLYKEKGVEVIAVSVLGEDRKTVENIIREKGITFRFLYDPKGKVTGLFSGEYYPGACPLRNIFLIDKNAKGKKAKAATIVMCPADV